MKIQLPSGEIRELSSVSKSKDTQASNSGKKGYLEKFTERSVATDERIQQRGTIQDTLKEQFSGGNMQKAMGVLEVLATPANAVESAISNVGLRMQKKARIDPNMPEDKSNLLRGLLEAKDLAKGFWQGLTLQEKGQYGDILKNAGVESTTADATGLFLNIAGTVKVLSAASRTFGSISKMSDRGIIKGGNQLVQATNSASEAVGSKVGEAFASVSDDAVNGMKFLDDVVKLPKSVLRKAEEVFGNMEDFASNMTVGKLREFKQFIGKLRPAAFGQAERGIAENIDVQDLNKVYAATKGLLRETIKKSRGEKVANDLMNLEKHYSEVTRANQTIRRAVVDPILKKATRGGKVAEGLAIEGDVTMRTALNTIKKSSWKANKEINNAVRLLEIYNRNKLAANLVGSATKAAVFGGVAGAIGGKALQKVTGKD